MKTFYTFFMLTILNFVYGQEVKVNFVSQEDQTAIPFVNVWFGNSEKGFISDENGQVNYDFTSVDKEAKMIVDMIGYELYQVKVADFLKSNHTISLVPDVIELEEVKFYDKKKFKEKNVGPDSKSKSVFFNIITNGSDEEDNLKEVAVYINSGKKRAKVLRINMNFAKYEHDFELPYRLVLYANNDGQPGEILNKKDIIGHFSKDKIVDQVFTINLEKHDLWIKGSFFISFQVLNNEYKKPINLSASMMHKSFLRSTYEQWQKLPMGLSPAINADLLIEK